MPPEAVICDWNGTLVRYRDERPLLEAVAVGLFWTSFPLHPLRMVRILKARGALEALHAEAGRDAEADFVRKLFEVYNGRIIDGVPVSLVRRSIDSYARRNETQAQLDRRVLRTIKRCHEAGKTTGVFSAGYRYGIESILAVSDYRDCFDFLRADELKEEKGKAVGFGLNIYKNKPSLLAQLLKERNLDASKTAYIGDSEDDAGCFDMVGYPVVALLAPGELKRRYARENRAFVPADEEELVNYLIQS